MLSRQVWHLKVRHNLENLRPSNMGWDISMEACEYFSLKVDEKWKRSSTSVWHEVALPYVG